ncbi:non-ribosomal peptide synthetase [Peristeroidobacter soli]|uniref:non-ribosomal peptide synthetase n=1 Tax=Peristeroidobacter soli TaxID=2497877 RepID=UPI00101BE313|nr:non-ribosomal peptide synthase/polyketide synthase [Peristeroidobacter soli]
MNALRPPSEGLTNDLVAHLRSLAATRPTDTALIVASSDGEIVLQYAELDRRARALAAQLQARFAPGDRAVLLLDNDEHYVVGFLGCLYAGLVAVPAFPPETRREQHVARLQSIAKDAQARCVLTSSHLLTTIQSASELLRGTQLLLVDVLSSGDADRWLARELRDEDVVFLQYTSGSTASPKGVVVDHGNLLANERAIRRSLGVSSTDVFVSWLPLFHDMGLVGGLFQPLFSGIPLVLMSPAYFLERPVRWLELISRHAGTISGGPDFAYRLCVERVPEAQLKLLDLSSWRVAFSGAEPVRYDTLHAFAERFKVAGFDPQALYPCYGLAEATLLVTGVQRGGGMNARTYSSELLAKGRATPSEQGTTLVACGTSHDQHNVRIVDPTTGAKQPDARVGEIWVTGPSVSRGYWQRDAETEETFVARDGERWLRTGDLGFIHRRQLFITGRQKDLIILRGYNVYPQDIEQAIETQIEAVRKGRVAAFAIETDAGEGVGVAVEVSRSLQKLIPPQRLFDELSAVVGAVCRESLAVAVLLNPGGLPRTSSGKLQRSACRGGWREGSLDSYAVIERGQFAGAAGNEVEPSLTDMQDKLGEIWRGVLKVDRVLTADANFFALGGTSISAAQVAARVAHELGANVAPGSLLDTPTLAGFATQIEKAPRSEAFSIARLHRDRSLPPSPAQRRMWFAWQLDPKGAAYNVGGGLRLRGPVDATIVQRTLDELVRRHEILRTRFGDDNGEVKLLIDDPAPVVLRTEDLRDWPSAARAMRAEQLSLSELQEPFDLQAGPVLRATLTVLADDEQLLLLTIHHIAADGISVALLVDEFVRLYGALRRRQPIPLPQSLQYLDHAAWQETRLDGGERARQLAYWIQQLGRDAPDVAPHADRAHTTPSDDHGRRRTVPMDASLTRGLRELAKRHDMTVFMVLLAAWKIVLARNSGHRDIRVGAPMANRRTLESGSLVGPFVNTVVLRTSLEGNPSVAELLQRIKRTVVEAHAHQDLPFEQLVEALAPDRTSARHPLFQVMHNHQRRERTAFDELAPLQVEAFERVGHTARFELSLNTEEEGDRLMAAITYRTALYDDATIDRLAGHWLNALRAAVASAVVRIDEVPLLSDLEYAKLLHEFNATTRRYPAQGFLQQYIARQVAHTPDALAVVFNDERCTYRQLNDCANVLAVRLREHGVGPDVVVGICSERSMALVIGLLAILKAGGAYLPLDPTYPQSRLEYILDDARPRVVLAERNVMNVLPASAGAVAWLLDPQWTSPAEARVDDICVDVHGGNLAYCLYTSGSTGQPKCAANTHGALLNQLLWRQEVYALRTEDRVLHKTPIGFDVSVWEIFWPLMTGATLVIAPPGAHRDPWRLSEIVRDQGVTTLHFVPPMLSAFLETGELTRCDSLRRVFVGGQALSTVAQSAFFRQSAASLYNLYGPTEAAIDVSFWECRADSQDRVVPMGRALANTQLYVLDPELAPVPVGAVGELYIGGVQLARGYAGRPGLTAQRFVPNPFAPGERLYRSGDLVRYRSDGALEYVGRIDHQVKVRGFRIELGEIEARLREHPEVREAVVSVGRDRIGENELVAYVIRAGVADVADELECRERLHRHLAQRLPDYMLPMHYAWLDALPLLSNGKLDRAALAAYQPASGRRTFTAPRSEIERRVAAIWSQVLAVEDIGIHDSFFELGGHSLLATQAIARVRAAFDIDVPLRTLFETPNLAEFSAEVRKSVEGGQKNAFGPIESVDRSQPIPLSYAQQRMWLLWQIDPHSVAYNLAGAVKLTGLLNDAAIDAALRALVRRHETLRTTFTIMNDVPTQVIAPELDISIERQDLRALAAVDRQAELQRLSQAEAHRPFCLRSGPLLRVVLLRLDEREHVMLVTTHHIVAEGWAIDIFTREFVTLYGALCDGQVPALAPLTFQYADYMHWQQRWLESGERDRQLEYWKRQLAGDHEVLALPTDRPRPKVLSARGDVFRFQIEPELAQRLRAFSTERGMTLFMTLLAGMFALLYRYSAQSDLRVGVPVANRVRPEAEGLIGAFLNTQVLRCHLDGAKTFAQLLSQVKQTAIGAQSHQDLPFDRLVDAIRPPRSLGFHPLFQVMLNVHRWEFQRRTRMGELVVEFLPNDVRAAKLDWMLDVGDISEALDCCLTYSTDLFDRATVERMCAHWVELLKRMSERSDVAIGSVALLGTRERALLSHWGINERRFDALPPVHALIEQQARRSGEAIALAQGDVPLSYAELNRHANQLAHRLIALGVRAETRVGIAIERRPEMVVGLLAVLKAGGAYVPLDPSYPAERLDYMRRDSGIEILLTTRTVRERLHDRMAVTCVLVDEPDWHEEPDTNLEVPLQSEHPAYAIYTSGSTGRPKGVLVRHGALSNFVQSMRLSPGLSAQDVLVAVTSLSFDIAALELYVPLCVGARVVVASEADARDGLALARLLEVSGATALQSTPAGWRMLLAAGWRGAAIKGLCGGEALQPELASQLCERGVALWNMYGPTETTIWSSTGEVRDARPALGYPVAATRLRVLTDDLQLAMPGMPGELYIGGEGLARGYLNRPALTAERFVADPTSSNGELLYRTGDRVRWGWDGELQHLGRIDHQIKVRGFRIEPGEIETQLLAQAGVREAAVVSRHGESGARLVAYVVGEAIESTTLREHLSQVLPDYMVPAAIMVLEQLPLTPNGKLDRSALPEPKFTSAAEYEPPRGAVEEAFAAVWKAVLRVERVGRHDNFFETGGDSIVGLQVVAQLHRMGWKVSPRQLFELQTVSELAQVAEYVGEAFKDTTIAPTEPLFHLSEAQRATLPVSVDSIEDVLPLTPMQQGMLLHTLLDPASGIYLMQDRSTIRSALDVQAFWDSWDAVLRRHAALRASFVWQGTETPFQIIHREVTLPKDHLDLRHLGRSDALAQVDAMLEDELANGFELDRAPLLRVRLAQVAQSEFHLIVSFHHMLMDAWCLGLLMGDVLAEYDARTLGKPLSAERPAPYRDFIAWLQRQDESAAREYWHDVLDGFEEVTPLPMRRHFAAGVAGSRMIDVTTALSAAQTKQLYAVAQRHQITPNTLTQGAWALVLARHADLDDVLFGVTVAGRPVDMPQLQRTLGLFINTVPLRVPMPGPERGIGVADWLRALFSQNLRSREFEHLPLVEVQTLNGRAHDNALFESLFVFENAPVEFSLLERAQQSSATKQSSRTHTNYPLTVVILPRPELILQITYDERCFDAATIDRLLASFRHVVEQFIAMPLAALRDIEALPRAERDALIDFGRGPLRHQPAEVDYISLFRQQVALHPQRVAARCDDRSVRYQALDTSSTQLAGLLRSAGVRAGDVVIVFSERNLGWLDMVLACFKAGAAYLAVDIETPPQRLARIFASSGAKVVVTDDAWLPELQAVTTLLPGAGPRVVSASQAITASLDFRATPMHPDQPAYVIFTSGSTGEPKGVVVTSAGMLNNQLSKIQSFPLGPRDVIAQTASPSFDISVWQLLGGLICGACVDIVPNDVAREPAALLERVRNHGITILESVPSLMQRMLALAPVPLPSLRVMMATGERIPPELARDWRARYSQSTLVNAYGPAECADDVTLHVETAMSAPSSHRSILPIGRPVDNFTLFVLDSRLEPVPLGAPGELHIAGIGVGLGYVERSDLTAERFIANPFDAGSGRLYRTGDRVRWNGEGQLEYLGRTDHQVKVRGFRVEPGEVESQLLAQPEIGEALVLAKETIAGSVLVAYVVTRSGQSIDSAELRRRLERTLPDYMVPATIAFLDSMPRNRNGKVDRKALPDPQFVSDALYEAPQGRMEVELAALWADVLGVPRVGRHDNFFQLGGHSLLALVLVERLRVRGWHAQVRSLFVYPKLSAFAEALAERQQAEIVVPPNGIPSGCTRIEPDMLALIELDAREIDLIESAVPGGASNIQDIYPLAPLQEGILFHHVLQAAGDAYTLPCLLAFDSSDRLLGFIDGLNRVIARHDILRSAVLWEGLREPVQVVYRQATVQLEWLKDEDTAASEGISDRLRARIDPHRYRVDARRAPMIAAFAAHEPARRRWLLQLACHHLVLDHTTLELIVNEIALIQQGQVERLPEPIPFRRFVAQARLGVSQAEHEKFFTHMLSDVEEPTAPFGLLDVQGDGIDIAEARLPLEAELSRQLRQHAQRNGVSAAVLFHLAWALVLARATGRDDVVFGTVLFGRMQGGEGAERALGMFINTLPVRIKLGTRPVEQCVREVHAVLTDLLTHEHASLALVQRCSAVADSPLFSALLNYRYGWQGGAGRNRRYGEGTELLETQERTNYPVTFCVDDLGEGFELSAQVSGSVGAQRVCELMQVALRSIAEALTIQSQRRICELGAIPVQEDRLLRKWSAGGARLDCPESLQRRVERQARERPDAIALLLNDEQIGYAELNHRANRLAHRLIASGVGAEARVGIAMERSIDLIVAMLAILKAGAAYVPLDPRYPADRLSYMMRDSGIGLLLTQGAVEHRLPIVDGVQSLRMETIDLRDEPAHDPNLPWHPDHLAYVIYTSGSTGRPKGAQLSHRNVSRLLAATHEWFHFNERDVWTLFHSYAFDFSVWEIFGALCHGGRLVIVPYEVSRSPEDFLALLRQRQVTVLNQTPSAFQQLMQVPALYDGTDLALRVVIFGGEALEPRSLRPWLDHFGDLTPRLINMYGITETTVHVTYRPIMKRDLEQACSPIGERIPDLGVRVLDAHLNAVPTGVPGELYVMGDGLSRGYLNRAGLSAERFIPDPFSEYGARLYRTGDLVRWTARGELEYLGRLDHQIKIRGFRIELGEIEAQLREQPGVSAAVVTANRSANGVRLVAYVVGREGTALDTVRIRERLSLVLPDHMLPSAIVEIERLPLNANGKLDLKALPEPGSVSTTEYQAPQGDIEAALASIWSDVLGVSRAGRNANFFELGGHSLLALRVVDRLRARGWQAQVRSLFQQPELAAFARTIALEADAPDMLVPPNLIPTGCTAIEPGMLTLVELTAEQIRAIEATVPGGPANIQDIYPLAPLQEGMLFHYLLQTEGDAYVMQNTFAFQSRRQLESFVDSFNRVIERHDILRTAVVWEGLTEAVQVIYRSAPLRVKWLDVPEASDTEAAVQLLDAHAHPRRFKIDVRRAPMFHAVALREATQGRWLLRLLSHHLIDDNTTVRRFIEEIILIQQGREAELPEPISFRHFVARARRSDSVAGHEAFFRKMLGEVNEPTAPFGLLDVRGSGDDVAEARLRLPAELSKQVREQAQRHGVSAAALFHLAWALVLGKTTGQSDVVFGTVLFGRMHGGEGAERALGLFINTLPIRIELGTNSVARCLRQTHEVLTDLMQHEHASLPLAQRCSGLPKGTPLFSALFNYRHGAAASDPSAVHVWEGMEVLSNEERTNYPITMSVDDSGERFELQAQVVPSLSATRVCEYLHHSLAELIGALAGQSQRLACELEMMTEAERTQLSRWSVSPSRLARTERIHDSIARRAAQSPEATALTFDDERVSYAELNVRANRLAHRLMALGVGPEVRVGIAMERSTELVVTILAILKAGGAYVPLDLGYPLERLRYMVDDSGMRLLLTQRRLVSGLPTSDAVRVLAIDEIDTPHESAVDPDVTLHPENLAYVIYTSGSTGRPKGSQISHASLSNYLCWAQAYYFEDAPDGGSFGLYSSLSFDLTVTSLFVPLLRGRTLRVFAEELPVADILKASFAPDSSIDAIKLTPSHISLLGQLGLPKARIRLAIVGGEALSAEQVRVLHGLNPAMQVYNEYGPTESTVGCVIQLVRRGEESIAIGTPIPGTCAYVLDARGMPVPIGVTGELYLGGAGLARGYLDRAGLTAERFVADPFGESGGRLYRTGDWVRWNARGELEYLGRIDHQVKIRGYRIELGEIESQLLAQPEVREAVVMAQGEKDGKRLIAYVAPEMSALDTAGGDADVASRGELVAQWESVFDGTYEGEGTAPSFRGWNSSYTDLPIPEAQMQEWLENTVARIQSLRPERILEIGCGVGLLVQHLAPRVANYLGRDLSACAVRDLSAWIRTQSALSHVSIQHAQASDFNGIREGAFDTLVLNSVAQYLPDADYFLGVLEGAARVVGPQGRLFIGDLRHLDHVPMFHASVQLSRASAQTTVGRLRSRIARAVAQDKELVLNPAFFHVLAAHLGMGGVEILLKRGRFDNELTRYRYDVVMNGARVEPVTHETFDGSAPDVLERVAAQLALKQSSAIAMRGIPNLRLARDLAAWRRLQAGDEQMTVGELLAQLEKEAPAGIDPEMLWTLGEAHGYHVEISWTPNVTDGSFDARFIDPGRARAQPASTPRSVELPEGWRALASDPARALCLQQLGGRLRERLLEAMPDYMVPAHIVVLDKLPLNANGKLDRKALPEPAYHATGHYEAPQSEAERALAAIWSSVLGVERVGRNDNFLELGGHSLTAMQMVALVRQRHGVELPIRVVFEKPTLAALAATEGFRGKFGQQRARQLAAIDALLTEVE